MEVLLVRVTWWLVLAVGAIECPVAKCQPYKEGICAVNTGSELHVNTNACLPTETCSIVSLLQWWGTAQPNSQYLCSSQTALMPNTTIQIPAVCLEVDENRMFKSGMGRVSCMSDSDCVMADGTVNPESCKCTLQQSGLGVCLPDQLNPIFFDYWEDCEDENLSELEILNFWSFYLSMWPYLQTDLPCSTYLAEVDTFTTLFIMYNQVGAELLQLLLLPLLS